MSWNRRPRALCHVCGNDVAVRSDGTLFRHQPSGYTESCIGSHYLVGEAIPGFIGPYHTPPAPKGWDPFDREESTMDKYRTEQKEAAARILARRHGWIPTYEQVITFLDEQVAERARFVGVTFAPSDSTMRARPQVYTYRLKDGPEVKIGDYVQVYSPITDQAELVRVVRLGRGDWDGDTKFASRITWSLLD